MNLDAEFEQLLENKALKDPLWAIAYGIHRLADATEKLTEKVDALGLNTDDPECVPGSGEKLAMVLEDGLKALTESLQRD